MSKKPNDVPDVVWAHRNELPAPTPGRVLVWTMKGPDTTPGGIAIPERARFPMTPRGVVIHHSPVSDVDDFVYLPGDLVYWAGQVGFPIKDVGDIEDRLWVIETKDLIAYRGRGKK